MRLSCSVIVASLGLAVGLSLPVGAQVIDTPTSRALEFFATLAPGDPVSVIRSLGPRPASAEESARVVAMLPEEGALTPTADEEAKLLSLESILVYHDRRHAFDIKVIDVPQVVVGLHQRTVLLLSRPALQKLSASELQAMVAREIGHDYFWPEYERAELRRDAAARQALELKCDGIAGLTLTALGLKVAALYEGMQKMGSFNEKLGATAGALGYPSLRERRKFMDALLAARVGSNRRRAPDESLQDVVDADALLDLTAVTRSLGK